MNSGLLIFIDARLDTQNLFVGNCKLQTFKYEWHICRSHWGQECVSFP